MHHTYKILSLLLDYPTGELKDALPGLMAVIGEEGGLNQSQCAKLRQFLDYAMPLTLADWQKHYVQLFDFTQNGNLYLFDHVYGDSRERGQAMVDLADMYMKSGFTPRPDELPDYLPLFLEYLSLLENPDDSGKLLKEVSAILENMKKALEKKETPYSFLLDILCSINEMKGAEAAT